MKNITNKVNLNGNLFASSQQETKPVNHVSFEGEIFVPICQCREPDRKVALIFIKHNHINTIGPLGTDTDIYQLHASPIIHGTPVSGPYNREIGLWSN